MRTNLLLCLLSVSLGCAGLHDLMTLQQQLAREFETSAITVNINNGNYLTIMFSNSPTAELPDADQAAFARRVAEYVRDQYPRYDSLKTIAVGFAKVTGIGPITYTDARVPYTFTPQDLGPRRHASRGPAQLEGEAAV